MADRPNFGMSESAKEELLSLFTFQGKSYGNFVAQQWCKYGKVYQIKTGGVFSDFVSDSYLQFNTAKERWEEGRASFFSCFFFYMKKVWGVYIPRAKQGKQVLSLERVTASSVGFIHAKGEDVQACLAEVLASPKGETPFLAERVFYDQLPTEERDIFNLLSHTSISEVCRQKHLTRTEVTKKINAWKTQYAKCQATCLSA